MMVVLLHEFGYRHDPGKLKFEVSCKIVMEMLSSTARSKFYIPELMQLRKCTNLSQSDGVPAWQDVSLQSPFTSCWVQNNGPSRFCILHVLK